MDDTLHNDARELVDAIKLILVQAGIDTTSACQLVKDDGKNRVTLYQMVNAHLCLRWVIDTSDPDETSISIELTEHVPDTVPLNSTIEIECTLERYTNAQPTFIHHESVSLTKDTGHPLWGFVTRYPKWDEYETRDRPKFAENIRRMAHYFKHGRV
ncbi:MAG: hypothetical protein WAZ14_03360 [Patescibacteria group bacterium]